MKQQVTVDELRRGPSHAVKVVHTHTVRWAFVVQIFGDGVY